MLLYEPYLDPQPCRQAPSSRLRRQDVEACGDVMPLYNIGIWCYPTIYITLCVQWLAQKFFSQCHARRHRALAHHAQANAVNSKNP